MKAELTHSAKTITFPNDEVVIPKYISGITGGRTLDVSGITDKYIRAGHVIITDGAGKYKPLPTTSGAYTTVPESWTICGVLYRTVLAATPWASIMTNGQLNAVALPIPLTPVLAAFKAACPLIELVKDEEA